MCIIYYCIINVKYIVQFGLDEKMFMKIQIHLIIFSIYILCALYIDSTNICDEKQFSCHISYE